MKLATMVTAASFALVWTQAAISDTRSVETPRTAPIAASAGMSDADVLADRHLALYRASRATVIGLREPAEDGHAISVRTSATAALPLPSDGQASDSAELSAR